MKGRNAALIAAIAGLGILAVVFIVLIGGGGGGDGGGDGQEEPGTRPTQQAGGGGCDNAPADALRLLGGEPLSLDPALTFTADDAEYVVEIFSGLVKLDRDLKVVPDLAEKIDVSPDGTVYTFTLRRNALFHDDRPVTAEDFKYSFDRAATLAQSGSLGSFAIESFLGDIVGARDVTRGRAQSISGVKVVNPATLEITIDTPKPYFLAKLTYPTAYVVQKQQVESNPQRWTQKPIGTGPYKMQRWDLGERIILEANEKYYAGAPKVKRVLYYLTGGSSLTQFENCEIDVSGIGIDDLERVQSPRDPLNSRYVSAETFSITYIGFNTTKPPFDDAKVRQAFAMAIDRAQIVRVILKEQVALANSILMPGLPGHNSSSAGPEFNPARAKQLIQESKYKSIDGLGKVTLSIGGGGGGATVGPYIEAIQEMWRQNLGIDVQISQAESASYFTDLDRGNYQMRVDGWIMDYPDPEDILDILFHSKSRYNQSRYASLEYDALIEKARTEKDNNARLKLYQDAERVLMQDLPWIPLNFGKSHIVVNPRVKGYKPYPIVIPFLQYVTIEQ